MARRGANIDSDHMLVVIKLRARICRASNTKQQQLRRFAVNRLKDRDVASRYYDELESELQGVQAQPLSLDEILKKLEEKIQRVAKNTIGYTRRGVCKGERGKERRQRHRASHPNQNQRSQECLQSSPDKKEAYVQKKRQGSSTKRLRHRSIQDYRKFYKRQNDVKRPFKPQVAMCRAKTGELLTNKNQVQARWKEHFEEHLNEGSESEQPTRPVNLRDDGVDIDLPSCEEIEGARR
jgi:hypothetical protein